MLNFVNLIAFCSVNATADGKKALMQLANGDMRRVLNLLQSTAMAYAVVDQQNVYLTAGAALPEVSFEALFILLVKVMYKICGCDS